MPSARHGITVGGAQGSIGLLLVVVAGSCNSGTVAECEKVASGAIRDACFYKTALELNSRSLCLRQRRPDQQAACLSEFANRSDATPCEEADAIYPVPMCFHRLALLTEQVGLCDHIASFEGRVRCVMDLALHTRDAKWCKHMSAPKDRDDCLANLAPKIEDVAICDGIQDRFRRDRCRAGGDSTYFGGVACDRIESIRRRDDCYLAVVNDVRKSEGLSEVTNDLCDKVVMSKTRCRFALAKSHPAACERIGSGPDSISRRLCYDAAFDRSRTSCADIVEAAARLACEARVPVLAKDSATCTALTNADAADDCWDAVAATDGALCLRIIQSDLRSMCLRKNWAKAKDGGVCSSLTPVALSQACAAHFGLESRARNR